MDLRRIGWLEGMIDGEGSLSISKNKTKECKRGFSYRPRLSFGQSDNFSIPEIIRIVFKLTNLENVGKNTRTYEKWKTQNRIWFESNILRKLLPQLKLIIKEKQRLLMIEFLDLISKNKKGFTINDDRLEEIYLEMKELNK